MVYWDTKTPVMVFDYGMDWTPVLAQLGAGLTIVDSAWSRLSGNALSGLGAIDGDGKGTTVRISGGTDGSSSIFRNTVTLSDGQVLEEDAYIKIEA